MKYKYISLDGVEHEIKHAEINWKFYDCYYRFTGETMDGTKHDGYVMWATGSQCDEVLLTEVDTESAKAENERLLALNLHAHDLSWVGIEASDNDIWALCDLCGRSHPVQIGCYDDYAIQD